MNTYLKGFYLVLISILVFPALGAQRDWLKKQDINLTDAEAGGILEISDIDFNPDQSILYTGGTKQIGWFERDAVDGTLLHSGVLERSPMLDLLKTIWISPDGLFMYAHSELGISWFDINQSDGSLSFIDSVLFLDPYFFSSDLMVPTNNGKFIMAISESGSGVDRLIIFSRNEGTGEILPIDTVQFASPVRSLKVSPDGEHLYAGVDGDTVHWYAIDENLGSLTWEGSAVGTGTNGMPKIVMSPDGRHLYLINAGVSHFFRDTVTGALTFDQVMLFEDGFSDFEAENAIITTKESQFVLFYYEYTSPGFRWGRSWYSMNNITGALTPISSELTWSTSSLLLDQNENHLYAAYQSSNGGIMLNQGNYVPELITQSTELPDSLDESVLFTDTLLVSDADTSDAVTFHLLTYSEPTSIGYALGNCSDTVFATVDSLTGILSWEPAQCYASEYSYHILIEVRDECGSTDTLDYSPFVRNVNDPPIITAKDSSADTVTFYEDDNNNRQFSITVTDRDIYEELTYRAFINGDSVGTSYGGIDFSPWHYEVGTYTLMSIVSDDDGAADTATWTVIVIKVTVPPVEGSPTEGEELNPDWTLAWLASEDPDLGENPTYTVQVSDDSTFSTIVATGTVVSEREIALNELDNIDSLVHETVYFWRVSAEDSMGYNTGYSTGAGKFTFNNPLVSVLDNSPLKTIAFQNSPNPFGRSTQIRFGIPQGKSEPVSIEIFNQAGRKVSTLVNRHFSSGYHNVIWEAGNRPSGIYIYRIKLGSSYQRTMRMLKIR